MPRPLLNVTIRRSVRRRVAPQSRHANLGMLRCVPMQTRTLGRTASTIADSLVGRRRTFDVPLDLRLASGFRRAVLQALIDIDYGRTARYAPVAARVQV